MTTATKVAIKPLEDRIVVQANEAETTTASGLVTSKFSLQPSNRRPPKSSSMRFWTCKLVPIAPSKTTMRSFSVSRKLAIFSRTDFPVCPVAN